MGNQPQQDGDDAKKVSTTDAVFQSIWEARERGQVASRSTIQAETRLPLTIVDDRIKHLKAVGKIRLAGNVPGIFEPCEDRGEDRAISHTILPNGRVKLEIGDNCIDVSMREAKNIGLSFAGFALQFRGM